MNRNRNRKINLQLFAVEEGLTKKDNLNVRAREIDFVTSFGRDIQHLLQVLGIAKPIKKANGTALKTKKVTGELKDGHVAEGDVIPLSEYKVEEEVYDSIEIEKFRKAVSIEAIAEKGYDVAVNDTDEQLKLDLQDKVTGRFYNQLKKGSLTGNGTTFQKAVAKSIGLVKDKFKKMHKKVTGVVTFVNTLDLYDYLGETPVTIQSAFGLDYIEKFLGADAVIVSSEIPAKTVISVPKNNLVAYYVDPADSEFAKAGLSYTTDSTTGFVGFHAQGTYERAISDMFAIMGLRIFCEYQDGISNVAIGGSATQKLGTLTVESAQGKKSGDSKITIKEQLQSPNNTFRYKTNPSSAAEAAYGADVKLWNEIKTGDEIEVTNGHHVTVVEADPGFKAIAKGDVVAKAKA